MLLYPYDAGMPINNTASGDILFVHGTDMLSWCVSWAQRLKPASRAYAIWTHVALYVDQNSSIIESTMSGVAKVKDIKYQSFPRLVARLDISDEDRARMVTFATSCLGLSYGLVEDVSIALVLLTHTKIRFSISDEIICSELVAKALERTSYILPDDPETTMPADLVTFFTKG